VEDRLPIRHLKQTTSSTGPELPPATSQDMEVVVDEAASAAGTPKRPRKTYGQDESVSDNGRPFLDRRSRKKLKQQQKRKSAEKPGSRGRSTLQQHSLLEFAQSKDPFKPSGPVARSPQAADPLAGSQPPRKASVDSATTAKGTDVGQ